MIDDLAERFKCHLRVGGFGHRFRLYTVRAAAQVAAPADETKPAASTSEQAPLGGEVESAFANELPAIADAASPFAAGASEEASPFAAPTSEPAPSAVAEAPATASSEAVPTATVEAPATAVPVASGPEPVSADVPTENAPAAASDDGFSIPDEIVDMLVERVASRLTRDVIEEVVWQVVPDLAEKLIKKKLEDLS